MSDRESYLAGLLRHLDGLVTPGVVELLREAYDAGAAATAFDLGVKSATAITEMIETCAARGARIANLEELVRWMANTVHAAHHGKGPDAMVTWHKCQRGFCSSVRRGLGELELGGEPTEGKEGE